MKINFDSLSQICLWMAVISPRVSQSIRTVITALDALVERNTMPPLTVQTAKVRIFKEIWFWSISFKVSAKRSSFVWRAAAFTIVSYSLNSRQTVIWSGSIRPRMMMSWHLLRGWPHLTSEEWSIRPRLLRFDICKQWLLQLSFTSSLISAKHTTKIIATYARAQPNVQVLRHVRIQ